jgi:hypothetical protein
MQHFAINYWALVVATVVKILIGMVWYSPQLFGKHWSQLIHCTPGEMKARMPKALLGDFVRFRPSKLATTKLIFIADSCGAGRRRTQMATIRNRRVVADPGGMHLRPRKKPVAVADSPMQESISVTGLDKGCLSLFRSCRLTARIG